MKLHTAVKLIITFILLFIVPQVSADNKELLERSWEYIDKKECDKARQLFQKPISSPEEQCIYGKSICCSSLDKVTNNDVDEALAYLNEASEKLAQNDEYMFRWIEDAKMQCREMSESLTDSTKLSQEEMITERQERAEVWSHYSGKIMSGCRQDNLSPVLVPDDKDFDSSRWHYVAPKFGMMSSDLMPSKDYLKNVLKDYVGDKPQYKLCAPFIAISATQDPQRICQEAHRFTDYFVATYAAIRPPTWIVLYHYPQNGQQLNEHAKRTTGQIRCDNVLGFFDWRRQSIVFKAPDNFFGTFRHELTHALMFWDIPMAPRWLEEGMAAMYEHTDLNYQSLENPWRTKVMNKNKIDQITLTMFSDKVLSKSILEFESRPVGATISREVMRKLQQCGDLPGLYNAIKKQYKKDEILKVYRAEPHQQPAVELLKSWQDKIQQYSDSSISGKTCL